MILDTTIYLVVLRRGRFKLACHDKEVSLHFHQVFVDHWNIVQPIFSVLEHLLELVKSSVENLLLSLFTVLLNH